MTVRRLDAPQDVPAFRTLRLEMLKTDPDAYASTFADWVDLPDAEWEGHFASTPVWAPFDGGLPIGMMAYMRERPSKMTHRASLAWSACHPIGEGVAWQISCSTQC